MEWHNYRVGGMVSKTSDDATLWRTEKGMVEITGNTLAISVRVCGGRKGYVLHGKGRLLLDAIVETEEGAAGKPVEKELSDAFLMLGEADGIDGLLTEANAEDLSRIGYKNQQECLAKAEGLCHRFLRDGVHGQRYLDFEDGVIFAFPDESGKMDVLLAEGSKLVYKAKDTVFVSSGDNVVLRMPGEAVCNSGGKSVIVKRDRSVTIKSSRAGDHQNGHFCPES